MSPHYIALAMAHRFVVGHRLPGQHEVYGIDVDCPSMEDAQAVATRMNEERKRQLAADMRRQREEGRRD